jgi:PAS domain S-box-containing protein
VSIAERLRSSESRFRTFTEASPDAIHVLRDGQLLYMNPAAKRLFGGVELGAELRQIVHEDDAPILSDRMNRILAGEALRPYEYRVLHPSGEVVTVEISSIPIEYEGAPCLLGFGRDVTERKRMQGRLIQADRMATVGTLATGVAHEINNPLTYVVLHLEKLRMSLSRLVPDEAARGDAQHMLAEALDGAERVRVIVQDLLSLARSDTSTHGPTDVRKVVTTALKLASPVLDGRAEVVPELEETAPVRANAAWLGQVFVNLLVNAGQAFGGDDPKVNRVRALTRTDEEGWIEVSIEDNGPGIPTEIADRIFDPFFTTKEAGTGTGLGLAISRSVIDSLGGEIDVQSRPGKGTRFRVRLPPLSRTGLMTERPRSIRASIEDGLRTGEYPAIDPDFEP